MVFIKILIHLKSTQYLLKNSNFSSYKVLKYVKGSDGMVYSVNLICLLLQTDLGLH